MTPERARFVLAITMVLAFFGIVAIVMMGLVDITNAEMAKLVGLIVGTVGGWVGRTVFSYFKEGET